jgi:hypothetical protein
LAFSLLMLIRIMSGRFGSSSTFCTILLRSNPITVWPTLKRAPRWDFTE